MISVDSPNRHELEIPFLTSSNPYVGPQTFSAEQAHLFFGREREARDLLSLVIANRVVLFFAQSGAGKSSLINTRLVPQLLARDFEVLPIARVGGGEADFEIQPLNIYAHTLMTYLDGRQELHAIFANHTLAELLPAMTWNGTAWRYMGGLEGEIIEGQDPTSIDEYELRPRVLIIDQFEEILTTHPQAWEQRPLFFEQLRVALEEDPYLWLVLTIREDYVGGLTPFIHLLPGALRTRYHMERMDVESALDAVHKPALLGGREFGSGVAEQLVDNLRQIRIVGQPNTHSSQYLEPVQLQVVCYQLWQNLDAERTDADLTAQAQLEPSEIRTEITQTDLLESGDVDTALTDFYEQALQEVLATSNVNATERKLRDWFSNQMITSAQTRSMTYRNEEEGQTGGLSNAIVDALAARFLLRTELRSGGAWTELIHDRFIIPIRQANALWLSTNPNPVTIAYQRWIKHNTAAEYLPDESVLAELEAFVGNNPDDVSLDEQLFLARAKNQAKVNARVAKNKRQYRRHLQWIGLIMVTLLSLLTGWALFNARSARTAEIEARAAEESAQYQAQIARSRLLAQLAALSSSELYAGRTETALAVAVEAGRATEDAPVDTLEAYLAMDAAIGLPYRSRHIFYIPAKRILQAVWHENEDQHELITVTSDNAIHIHRLETDDEKITLFGHQDLVNQVELSHDNRKIVSSSDDGTARVWDVETGSELMAFTGHENSVLSARWNSDGTKILTASADTMASIWDVESGTESVMLRGHRDRVYDAKWNQDETLILTNGADNSARIWDAETGRELLNMDSHNGRVFHALWSQNEEQIVTSSADNTARIWDVETGEELLRLEGHRGRVYQSVWNQDESQILTSSDDNTVRIWDAETGEELRTLTGHLGLVSYMGWNQDESKILTSSDDSTARVWNAESGAEEIVLRGHKDRIFQADWNQDESQIVTISNDNTVRFWYVDASSASTIIQGHTEDILDISWSQDERKVLTASWDETAAIWDAISGEQQIVFSGHQGPVWQARWNDAEDKILTSSDDKSARIWDADTSRQLAALTGHTDRVWRAIWNQDESQVLTSSLDNTVRIWNARTGQELFVLQGHTDSVWQAEWSQDERKILTSSDDNTVRIWDAESGRELVTLKGHSGDILQAKWNRDESQILTSSHDYSARLWDAETGAELITFQGHTGAIREVLWSRDERKILTCSDDGSARIWDAETGDELSILVGHKDAVQQALWNRDESKIVTRSADNTARLWDAETGAELIRFQGHQAPIRKILWSQDESRILTSSDDNSARIWDVNTGKEQIRLQGHQASIREMLWSQDENKVLTSSNDNSARIWPATINAMLKIACKQLPRNLDWDEWNRYMDIAYRPTCLDAPIPPDVIAATE